MKKGFTLIELLVVVSIIGLMSSVVLAALQDARTKGKVSQMTRTLVEIRNAAELYRTDNGDYPVNISTISAYASVLSPKYISTISPNPFNNTQPYLLAIQSNSVFRVFCSETPTFPPNNQGKFMIWTSTTVTSGVNLKKAYVTLPPNQIVFQGYCID